MSTNYETLEPVLNDDGEPQWLIYKGTKKVSTTNTKKKLKDAIQERRPLEEKKIFELQPQGMWQCQKCGAVIQSNPSAPSECLEDQGGCGRVSTFKPITKTIKIDLWTLPRWEDIPVENLDMMGLFDDTVDLIKQLLVFSKDIEYKIYTLWIFSTWKLDCWDAVGYPTFIGIPDSGKTRALRIIHKLAYRAPKAGGVKQAVIPRLCHYHNVTLLIDEAHTKLNPRTESGAGLLEFVKDSYKRDSVYITCDNNDQEEVIVTRNFGFKAFAGEKSFNTGLLTRAIIFWMEKDDPKISKLSYVKDDFDRIRTGLLNYKYKFDDPPDLGNDFCLRGRTREIFESIIATGKHIGVEVDDIIEYAKKRSEREQEILQGTVQYEILAIIKKSEENPTLDDAPDKIKTEDILDRLGWLTGDKKEDKSNRQKFGYILGDMGLETKRTREGRYLFYHEGENDTRLKRLYKRYKLC